MHEISMRIVWLLYAPLWLAICSSRTSHLNSVTIEHGCLHCAAKLMRGPDKRCNYGKCSISHLHFFSLFPYMAVALPCAHRFRFPRHS